MVMFGLTRGECILIAFIFALVYGAGLLPKLAALLSRWSASPSKTDKAGVSPAKADD
jgi:hypothetical protein